MKAAGTSEIKQQLKQFSSVQLVEIIIRLARFKKDNKDLISYLLFEADDPERYMQSVKKEMDEDFAGINTSHLYFFKKSIRRILRQTNKYIRYAGSKIAEVELLLHFCHNIKKSGISFGKGTALAKLFDNQLKKIHQAIETLHEDLQYDYMRQYHLLVENKQP